MATIKHFHAATMPCLTDSLATLRDGTLADMMRDGAAMTEGDTPLRSDFKDGRILFNYEGAGYMVVVECSPEEEIEFLS